MNKIKTLIGAAALVLTISAINSCGKDNNVTPPSPIGGFNNSDEVGATNLKAKWTFEGSNNETVSSTAPIASSGASFSTGLKGQGLVLNNGYMLFPTLAGLNVANIGSITISAWIKTQNNGAGPTVVFGLTQDTAVQNDWNNGSALMFLENGRPAAYNDTLVLKGAFTTYPAGLPVRGDNINDYGVRETDFKTVLGANRWVHYVFRYDGVNSNIDLFADGVLVSNNNFRHRETAPGVGTGPLITTLPTYAIIGGFPNAATGFSHSAAQSWQNKFTGSIDEVRVWNTPLSDANISALYQLEKVGR
jgi:hypothetical protein